MTEQERAKASAEAYQKLRQELDSRLKADRRLAEIAEKIKSGRAGFQDTAEYSEIVSKHLAQVIQDGIGRISNPSGLQMVCESLLKDHYEAINDVLGSVQTTLDEANGIHIRPQKASFPEKRVQQVAHSLVDPTVAAETIHRRAGAPVENVAKSMHDDYMQENAKFRSDAGLECWIVRTTDGKCCAWCTSMAGRYLYGTEPQDVYRRHDNCGCTVIYENGRQRQNVWTKKSWEVPEAAKESGKPVRLDYKQAKELEKKNLSQFRGLTSGGGSGIIKSEDGFTVYHEITDDAISRIPKIDVFESDALNVKHQEAAKALLQEAKKHPPAGRELLIVYDSDMNLIPDHGYIIGKVGSVKGDNPGVPYHALHNHGSGETLSYKDLIGFVENPDMLSVSAVGNTGSLFSIAKTNAADEFGYRYFLGNKSKAIIYSVDDTDFTLGKLVDEKERKKLQKVAAQLNETQRADLANAIRSQMEICLKGGERYGYKYRSQTT